MVHRLTEPRLWNWMSRMANTVDEIRTNSFSWKNNDCVSGLAVPIVEAITGRNLLEDWGEYSSAREALVALGRMGFESLGDAVASVLDEQHVSLARVGDLAVIETSGGVGQAMAVFDTSSLITLTEDGIGREPVERAIRSFRVGM